MSVVHPKGQIQQQDENSCGLAILLVGMFLCELYLDILLHSFNMKCAIVLNYIFQNALYELKLITYKTIHEVSTKF